MCLAAVSIGQSERFPFVLASNRDEFFARASQALAWWQPGPGREPILSGRDLSGGGTWLGLNAAGQLALVTNVREPGRHLEGSPSRGELVLQCLAQPDRVVELAQTPRNGFNLLSIDLKRAGGPQPKHRATGQWLSNRPRVMHQAIQAGSHGLSNASLDTPWPKVVRLKQRLAEAVARDAALDALLDEIFAALQDRLPAADAELPQTGVPIERERQLSSAFIRIADDVGGATAAYGTRCSTVVIVQARAGRRTVHVLERSYDASGHDAGLQAERFELPP